MSHRNPVTLQGLRNGLASIADRCGVDLVGEGVRTDQATDGYEVRVKNRHVDWYSVAIIKPGEEIENARWVMVGLCEACAEGPSQ